MAGVTLILLGSLLLLDFNGSVEMRFAAFAPIALAAVGAILLALGLSRRT